MHRRYLSPLAARSTSCWPNPKRSEYWCWRGDHPGPSNFNRLLEINEAEFVRQVQGTFKLGIEFNDWSRIGDSYIHGFGTIGRDLGLLPLHQYWLKARAAGQAKDMAVIRLARSLPRSESSGVPSERRAIRRGGNHIRLSFRRGLLCALPAPVRRGRARVKSKARSSRYNKNGESGFVESIELESRKAIQADLSWITRDFGRCSRRNPGCRLRGLDALAPCDRAPVAPCGKVVPPTPYTRSTARKSGWQYASLSSIGPATGTCTAVSSQRR